MLPRPDPPPRVGVLQRARGHLMDLTPLKISRDFRLLFFGHSVSNFGDEIVAVAIPFQVFKITGSNFAVGLLGLAALIPVFVFPIIGGTVADAVERRRLVTVTHALLAVMSGLMAINALLPNPLLWPMYVFTFFAAGLYTFNRPALDTWPARLLDGELLPSSNALDAGFGTFAGMLGPVAAGFLLVAIKPAGVYLFDVATFAVVILAIRLMRPSPPAHEDNEVSWAGVKVSGIFRLSIIQAAVEDRFRGRLEGIGMAVWATGPALGDFESGGVATLTTPAISIVSGGLITIVGVGILRSFAPGFWRYDARHPTT